ncbi:hypothetical protein J6590_051754 [Homalodisca vitripennis]|nr:hypothetical protein J6590_051754 [Homalodisca vitripennis]
MACRVCFEDFQTTFHFLSEPIGKSSPTPSDRYIAGASLQQSRRQAHSYLNLPQQNCTVHPVDGPVEARTGYNWTVLSLINVTHYAISAQLGWTGVQRSGFRPPSTYKQLKFNTRSDLAVRKL